MIYFFLLLQNYFWFKYGDPIWTADNPFPVNINYLFRDTLLSLRPNLKITLTYEEAKNAVFEVQKKFLANMPLPAKQVSTIYICVYFFITLYV